jgi:hypothetical protein
MPKTPRLGHVGLGLVLARAGADVGEPLRVQLVDGIASVPGNGVVQRSVLHVHPVLDIDLRLERIENDLLIRHLLLSPSPGCAGISILCFRG